MICLAALVFALLLGAPVPLAAQDPSGQPPPAHIDIVDGDATLERDTDRLAADAGMPVISGDRLRTGRGRLALLFPDGTSVDLDEFSGLEIESTSLLRLTAGRIRVTVPQETTGTIDVETPTAAAHIEAPGAYQIAVMGSTSYAQTELAVERGSAELEGDRGSVKLRAGERSVAWPNDVPSRPELVTTARLDAFERWVLARQDERAGRSAQYLPPDLRTYGGTLDRYGTWGFEGGYGYVWYPAVAAGWRPYYTGYWTTVGSYGWTWIGAERWAWPTHHYGRWGYMRNRWFWIPDRRWAPAWVAWGGAPGYVGWCPLGFDNRPIFDLSASFANGGWTVLPRERFGVHRAYVNRFAIAPRSLSGARPLISQSGPPAWTRPPGRRINGAAGSERAVRRYRPEDRGVPSARPPAAGGSVATGAARGSADRRSPASGSIAPGGPMSGRGRSDRTRPDPARRDPRSLDRMPSAQPRFSPFGDFRRGDSRGAPPTAATPPASGGTADSVRPPRAPAGGNGSPPDSTAQPRVYLPPPAPAAVAPSSRGSSNSRGGSISGAGRTAAPRGGEAQGAGAAPAPQGSRGDGRAHDPGARRPR